MRRLHGGRALLLSCWLTRTCFDGCRDVDLALDLRGRGRPHLYTPPPPGMDCVRQLQGRQGTAPSPCHAGPRLTTPSPYTHSLYALPPHGACWTTPRPERQAGLITVCLPACLTMASATRQSTLSLSRWAKMSPAAPVVMASTLGPDTSPSGKQTGNGTEAIGIS